MSRKHQCEIIYGLSFLFAVLLRLEAKLQEPSAMFAFGDSLLDVGNNNWLPFSLAKANFPHNGIDYRGGVPTGRFCNGRNLADILGDSIGVPSPPPYLSPFTKGPLILQGVNFASGGSGILNETGSTVIQRVPFSKQIKYFRKTSASIRKQLGRRAGILLITRAVYVVSVGSGDCLNYFRLESSLPDRYTPQQFVGYLASLFRLQVQELYKLGARRFILIGLGPVGCTPSMLSRFNSQQGECIEKVNDLVVKLNSAMREVLLEISEEHSNFKYAITNTYDLALDVINNPKTYGFEVAKEACCGAGKFNGQLICTPLTPFCENRDTHVFWDFLHPTEALLQLLVSMFLSGKPDEISPRNIQQLMASPV